MRVFVTGASGWIGSAVVPELLSNGHEVVGLARSAQSRARIEEAGAIALPGDLDDLSALRRGAAESDGVIHLANKHDWADPAESDRAERAAVEAMLAEVGGTDRPFLIANGLTGITPGRTTIETDVSPAVGPQSDRGGSENLVLDSASQGVRSMAVRFAPSVHGVGDWGFVAFLTTAARERGVSGYVGDGSTQWSAVHRTDAARLIRLGIESAPAGTRLHAVAEQEIPTRAIAEAIATVHGLPTASIDPTEAVAHFGVVGEYFASSMTASSDRTRALLGWEPSGPGLLDDILSGAYGRG